MSELRDTTSALRAFDKRLRVIEECLVFLVRNSVQEADWRHQQRNDAQAQSLRNEAHDRAIAQVQYACGAISHKLVEIEERFTNQAATRLADVSELRARLRNLETGEEITK